MTRPPVEVCGGARLPLGMPPARFLRDYWQKRPLLIRNAFPDFTPPLSPDDLAGLACMEGALARIVMRAPASHSSPFQGRPRLHLKPSPTSNDFQAKTPHSRRRGKDDEWKVVTGPFEEGLFAQLPPSHWTLLVQDVDKWDAEVAALLECFDFLPCWRIDDVMVSYATDGGGVGAHVDQYDVFLLQGLGKRRWRISTDARAPQEFRDDVELRLLREFQPTHAWTLEPGDMLYLPPGVPHDGAALGECMTFSIGMRAPASAELLLAFAEDLASSLPESRCYADPDLQTARDSSEIGDDALRRARAALGPAARMMDAETFADFFGRFITAYRNARGATAPKRKVRPEALVRELRNSVFERHPWSRFAWRRTGRDAILFVSGERYPCPAAWARALCGKRVLHGAALAKLGERRAGVTLLAKLINGGHLARRKP